MTDTWTELALRAREGDERALAAFVRATQSDVWRLCRHLGDHDRADDLTQDVYVRVLHSLRGYRGEAPVRSWLFSIVRRVVAEDLAQRARRRRTPVLDREPQHDPHGAVALHALLGELDGDRRLAFVLTQVLGYTYAEAAEVCECPVGTIRSRVARAREALVGLLDPDAESAQTHALDPPSRRRRAV